MISDKQMTAEELYAAIHGKCVAVDDFNAALLRERRLAEDVKYYTQEVKYLDVGVKLIFRPFVSPDGMVRLELAPQVSTARIKDIDALREAQQERMAEERAGA